MDLLLLLLKVSQEGKTERVRTLSVRRPQPHASNPWKEENAKIGGKKKSRLEQHERILSTLKTHHAVPPHQTLGHQDRSTKTLRMAIISDLYFIRRLLLSHNLCPSACLRSLKSEGILNIGTVSACVCEGREGEADAYLHVLK